METTTNSAATIPTAEELSAMIRDYREYRRIADDAAAAMDAIANRLKAIITAFSGAELRGPDYVVRWTTVNGTTLDKKALDAAHPGLIAQFTRPNVYKRFTVT